MAWRSLFAINNPTGKIGSTYEGVFNTASIGNLPIGNPTIKNIYSFSSLPVGNYSINLSFTLNRTAVGTEIRYLASGVSTSPTSSVIYPSTTHQTGDTLVLLNNTTFTSSFIFSVTDNNPIYINLVARIEASVGLPTISNDIGWYCIATKIA